MKTSEQINDILLEALKALLADHQSLRRISKEAVAGPCPIEAQAEYAIQLAEADGKQTE